MMRRVTSSGAAGELMAEKKNLWARSANPDERRKAAQRHEKSQSEKEMRTQNVVKESPWDKLRGGKGGKR